MVARLSFKPHSTKTVVKMSHAGGGVITSANSSIQDHRDEAVSNMAPLCQLDMAGVT